MIKTSTILLIDDNDILLSLLYMHLSRQGFDVICGLDGASALKKISPLQQPEIIITDIMMPEKDGLEVIDTIKRTMPETKIIAMSGGGRVNFTDVLHIARELGAHAIIKKPFEMSRLDQAISDIRNRTEKPVSLGRQNTIVKHPKSVSNKMI